MFIHNGDVYNVTIITAFKSIIQNVCYQRNSMKMNTNTNIIKIQTIQLRCKQARHLIVCIMIGTILYRLTIAEGSKDYLFIYFCIVVSHEEVSH